MTSEIVRIREVSVLKMCPYGEVRLVYKSCKIIVLLLLFQQITAILSSKSLTRLEQLYSFSIKLLI